MITEAVLHLRMQRFQELLNTHGEPFLVGMISTLACIATDEEWKSVCDGAAEIAAANKAAK